MARFFVIYAKYCDIVLVCEWKSFLLCCVCLLTNFCCCCFDMYCISLVRNTQFLSLVFVLCMYVLCYVYVCVICRYRPQSIHVHVSSATNKARWRQRSQQYENFDVASVRETGVPLCCSILFSGRSNRGDSSSVRSRFPPGQIRL